MTTSRALVLGGGGVAGIAWQTGLLYGLESEGLDPADADFAVGTSAGATVAIQLGNGRSLEDWYSRQVDPEHQNEELRPTGMSVGDLWEFMIRLHEDGHDSVERRRRICAMAVAADTVEEPVRRAVVAGRLAGLSWPTRPVSIVVVDTDGGQRQCFDAGSGVDVVDAVTASSAVPGIWPPVTIGDRRYLDGGIASLCNADLAVGYDRVLILAPMVDPDLAKQRDGLGASSQVEVIQPDDDSLAAFGTDPLDPSVRSPVARAGLAQGRRIAPLLSSIWSV
jgi:NTE family protein